MLGINSISINICLRKLYNESKRFKLEIGQEIAKIESVVNRVSGCWKKHPDAWKAYPDALKRHPDAFIFQLQKQRTEMLKLD